MQLSNYIQNLPKLELHVHIEGTLEPEMKFELAKRNQIELEHKTPDEVRQSYDFDDLSSFLAAYYDGMNVLRTQQDFYDLTMAYLTKAAEQNVRYAEIFFDPQAHTGRGIQFADVITGIHLAQVDAHTKYGIITELIMCFLRDFQAEYAMATLLESQPYRKWIIGVGLDSDETGNPPNKFKKVFEKAKTLGYRVTNHCDVDIKNSIVHIEQALTENQVERLDHGTNIVENPKLVKYVANHKIGLTSCPISNKWISGQTKIDLVQQLVEQGVLVCINSDDPAYFGGYIAENLQLVADQTSNEFTKRLVNNAIQISWASPSLKAQLSQELANYSAN